jgi:hypothetical protein
LSGYPGTRSITLLKIWNHPLRLPDFVWGAVGGFRAGIGGNKE